MVIVSLSKLSGTAITIYMKFGQQPEEKRPEPADHMPSFSGARVHDFTRMRSEP